MSRREVARRPRCRTNRPSSEGLFARRRAGDLARPPRRGHHSCGTAPGSHRLRCVCTGRGVCARRRQPTRGQTAPASARLPGRRNGQWNPRRRRELATPSSSTSTSLLSSRPVRSRDPSPGAVASASQELAEGSVLERSAALGDLSVEPDVAEPPELVERRDEVGVRGAGSGVWPGSFPIEPAAQARRTSTSGIADSGTLRTRAPR